MNEAQAFNQKIIEEFRANGGVVGGPFEGAPMLLLGTIGAKSGASRTNPLVYLPDGERMIIFASYAGAPKHPPWYHNLVANSEVTVEVGTETFQAQAVTIDEPERSDLYARMAERMSAFADYAAKTDRVIPVISLTRV